MAQICLFLFSVFGFKIELSDSQHTSRLSKNGDINNLCSLHPVMQIPRTAEKAVQMYQRTVTEAVSERRFVTAASMSETSGIEVLLQRGSHNAERLLPSFRAKSGLGIQDTVHEGNESCQGEW
jgi:hypothetical protein